MSITIYTTPACWKCDKTKELFDREHIPYETVDLSKNPRSLARVKKLGYTEAPVVITSNAHWSGLDPQRIKTAIEYERPEHDLAIARSAVVSGPQFDL